MNYELDAGEAGTILDMIEIAMCDLDPSDDAEALEMYEALKMKFQKKN